MPGVYFTIQLIATSQPWRIHPRPQAGASSAFFRELSGHAITTSGVRFPLTPLFNTYGTVTLVGGALYSAWIFWRKRVLLHRTIGNILIASGALLPAFGGTFSRFGLPGALYISEFLGAVLLFIGFLRAVTPMGESLWSTVSHTKDG